MATQPQAAPFTVADFQELGEGPPYHQLIEGELFMSPSPNRYHQDIVRNLAFVLMRYLATHPEGVLYLAPMDVYLDDINVYEPDILFVSNARRDLLQDDGIHGAPDLVVEILSPSTARASSGRSIRCCSRFSASISRATRPSRCRSWTRARRLSRRFFPGWQFPPARFLNADRAHRAAVSAMQPATARRPPVIARRDGRSRSRK